MKIQATIKATKGEESVLCVLPNGKQVEITMVSSIGEDVMAEPDVHEALKILKRYMNW